MEAVNTESPTATPADASEKSGVFVVRKGDLTPGWRLVFGLGWLTVIVAMASTWNVSRQLGLATWWIGPPAQPTNVAVRMIPFVPAVLLLLGTFNRARYLPYAGIVGGFGIAAVSIPDFSRATRLGLLELVIGVAAIAMSAGAIVGLYRDQPNPTQPG